MSPKKQAGQDAPVSKTFASERFSQSSTNTDPKARVALTPLERFITSRSSSALDGMGGAVAGIVSGIVTCPLDVIKTKLQAQGGFRAQGGNSQGSGVPVYSGMLGTGRYILKEEGVKGLYRGLGPIILGYLPTWAVWFTMYGNAKEHFSKKIENPNIVNFFSAIIAGGTSTLVTNPIWVIKTRLMSQVSRNAVSNNARPPWHYSSTLDAAKKMYQHEGLLSFYSGLTPALLGLTHVAIQFPAYEYLKTQFTGQGMGLHGEGDESSHWIGILSASMLSKAIASMATYPHEVIRTRLQTQQRSMPSPSSEYTTFRLGGLGGSQGTPAVIEKAAKAVAPRYKGIVMTFRTIMREEGWRAFYAGMGTNMMRAIPAATVTMLTYEFVMSKIMDVKYEVSEKLEEP